MANVRTSYSMFTNSKSYCSSCKSYTGNDYHYVIWNSPEVLILNLDRFKYDQYGNKSKDTRLIIFNEMYSKEIGSKLFNMMQF